MKEIQKSDVETFFKNRTIGVILVRSIKEVKPDIKKTFELLKLEKKNSLGLFKDDVVTRGMIKKIKDYATFGNVSKETVDLVLSKKNPIKNNKKGEKYISYIFNLHPPIGGFERKGIKKPFAIGGVLGIRGDNINALIKKMIQK